jgi:tRNA-modifying protein YgfZ
VWGDDRALVEALPRGSAQDHEVFRIRHGIPAMGAELESSTIPAEAGVVDQSVSFTKGCYVGQELVARVDSRGNNTPRRLRGFLIEGDDLPDPGAELQVNDDVAGQLTSVGRSCERGIVALGYLKRAFEDATSVSVLARPGVSLSATVMAFPF